MNTDTPPVLSVITDAQGTHWMTWSTNCPGFSVQRAPKIGAVPWQDLTNIPIIIGPSFSIDLGSTEGGYFRLRKQ